MLNASFRANAEDRCYHCKDELFTKLAPQLQKSGTTSLGAGRPAL
jgi:PP-loop superfamily ATP-utilizing enzyme